MKQLFATLLSLSVLASGGLPVEHSLAGEPSRFTGHNNVIINDVDTAIAIALRAEQDVIVLKKTILVLQQKIATLEGKPGPQGPAGNDGAPGKDAEVDYTKIWAWLTEHKAEFTATGPTIEEILAALPTSQFVRVNEKGEAIDSIEFRLGQAVNFPPLTVNYRNESGTILDTQHVHAIGGTLDLRINVLTP
jgi:hypothetical protein